MLEDVRFQITITVMLASQFSQHNNCHMNSFCTFYKDTERKKLNKIDPHNNIFYIFQRYMPLGGNLISLAT